MPPLVGQITLGVYAVLLIVGGFAGYAKAGSKQSLIAGVTCGIVALVCEVLARYIPVAGLALGAAEAVFLVAFFGSRFAKKRKFMPAGMMTIVSLIVTFLLVASAGHVTPAAGP